MRVVTTAWPLQSMQAISMTLIIHASMAMQLRKHEPQIRGKVSGKPPPPFPSPSPSSSVPSCPGAHTSLRCTLYRSRSCLRACMVRTDVIWGMQDIYSTPPLQVVPVPQLPACMHGAHGCDLGHAKHTNSATFFTRSSTGTQFRFHITVKWVDASLTFLASHIQKSVSWSAAWTQQQQAESANITIRLVTLRCTVRFYGTVQ